MTRFTLPTLIFIVGLGVIASYLARVGVDMHRQGLREWEIAITLGITAGIDILVGLLALSVISHFR